MRSERAGTAGVFTADQANGSGDIIRITKREAEILGLLADGFQDKEIVNQLHISFGTLRTHISRLFQKSGHRRRSGLAAYWAMSRPEAPTLSNHLNASSDSGRANC
jgi:DNA-binding CsgD family transcriptional regulator